MKRWEAFTGESNYYSFFYGTNIKTTLKRTENKIISSEINWKEFQSDRKIKHLVKEKGENNVLDLKRLG